MNEDKIKQGITFLNGIKGKNISLDEQKKFLESKLTAEEIAEVYKRVGQETLSSTPSNTTSCPKALDRISHTDSHFQPNAQNLLEHPKSTSKATVASVAILSSLALTYVLDKYKDKNDKNLREELKDRVKEQLEESKTKVNRLESI